jgi:hypothetical protein
LIEKHTTARDLAGVPVPYRYAFLKKSLAKNFQDSSPHGKLGEHQQKRLIVRPSRTPA